ncbi:uncharacterized protein LOC128996177 [Macrosteles quadrilineatus]|uniref:uncharacterized protein LOC128996177 n=1 Tax=Macrosteles quadrilineatus TaxID=74068 RepID=UPI0023E199A8|nr:uncharacterized protein LOC128996177 [Macrosteles quadrilineatus]
MWFIFTVALYFSLTPVKACEQFEFSTIEVLQRFLWKRTTLPITTNVAMDEGWQSVGRDSTYNLEIYRYTNVNNFFILFYGNKLVGVGLVHAADSDPSFFSWSSTFGNGYMFKHTVTVDQKNIGYAMVLFVNPDELKQEATPICFTKFIHFEGTKNGDWHKVSIFENGIQNVEPRMKKQGCKNRFGHYYFYSLEDKTTCSRVHGFYCFYGDNGEMNGFGVFTEGMSVLNEPNDHPHPVIVFWPCADVKEIVTHNAKCMDKKASEGYVTTVIYLKEDEETVKFKCNKQVAHSP